jgi:hypothetical protein
VRAAWPHLKAAFVVFHCLALMLMAVPAPGGGMSKSAWADPTVQGEFEVWTERFNSWGADLTVQELEDHLWEVATAYMAKRKSVLKPFQPYYRYTGTTQSWRMFVAPHRYPARLHIDLKEGGVWRELYIARSSEADWRAWQLDHDRMRAAIFRFSWKPYRRYYESFTHWIARQAAADFPQAEQVRVRFWKYKTASPEMVRRGEVPEGKWILPRVLVLELYREEAE